MLKELLVYLPVAHGRTACESMLVLMAGGVQMVYEGIMSVFQALFVSVENTMPVALLRQLILVGGDPPCPTLSTLPHPQYTSQPHTAAVTMHHGVRISLACLCPLLKNMAAL
jgi:hypothetical protein